MDTKCELIEYNDAGDVGNLAEEDREKKQEEDEE